MARQVRITGEAARICDAEADELFRARSLEAREAREAQLVTWSSQQSEALIDQRHLDDTAQQWRRRFEAQNIPRPAHWGG